MQFNDQTKAERLLIYGVLCAGALIFAFPFLWMLATSMKTQREMEAERLQLLPVPPHPQMTTPYIDATEFKAPQRPNGIPESVWAAAEPRLLDLLGQIVDGWEPRLEGAGEDYEVPEWIQSATYRNEMVQGLAKRLAGRIGDEARREAISFEREHGSGDDSLVSDRQVATKLGDEAIEAGAQAILAEAETLVSGALLRQVFGDCYRRVVLGDLRVRTTDYQVKALYTGSEWRVASGPATLANVAELGLPCQEAHIEFTPDERQATFSIEPDLAAQSLTPGDVDRMFIGYRSDATWARATFEVVKEGRLFRSPELTSLDGLEWVEQQLRWPGDGDVDASRRPYQVLEEVGAAPEGSPEFQVSLHLEKATGLMAWGAKITRNYRQAFKEIPYARYIATSFALTILNIVLAIFSCTLVAYAFARLQWPGRDICFGILLATMMIPGQVTMIPGFLVMKWLGWYNTLLPLWVMSAFGAPFFIFLLRQFFKNIPKDLEDSARIDGCGFLRVYWHVMLPLVKPTIAVIAIYTFMNVWNNFMGPLIYVNDDRLFPLALGMFKFQLRSGGDIGLMMAGSFLMTLPVLILFFFLQRYFIQGVSLTGMKG